MRNIVFNVAVGCEECASAYQNYGVPLEVMRFEWALEEEFLILSDADDTSLDSRKASISSRLSLSQV